MISSYADLLSAVAAWLVRDDPDTVNRIPEFVQLAEADLRALAETRRIESGSLQLTSGLVTLPADVGTLLGVTVVSGVTQPLPLQVKTFEQVMLYRLQVGNIAAVPAVYAVEDDDLVLGPVPDQVYDASIRYIERLDLATQGTNWLLAEQPNAYLYGALIHSAPFLSDEGRLPTWKQLYADALRALRVAKDRGEFSGPLVSTVKTRLG